MRWWRDFAFLALILFTAPVVLSRPAAPQSWATTWAASPTACGAGDCGVLRNVENRTVRERVRVSIGGSRLRVRLSNEYGTSPLVIGAATVALTAAADRVAAPSA